MSHLEVIREIAASMSLLDEQGALREMDSLVMVEFLSAIEDRLQVTIPVGSVPLETFQSMESLAEVLGRLAA